MNFDLHVPGIAGVIQLSIAPVFLLTAIGALLGVLSTRLARAIDRSRHLETLLSNPTRRSAGGAVAAGPGGAVPGDARTELPDGDAVNAELRVLSRRVQWVNRAIVLATACGLLVCLVIATLFAGAVLDSDTSPLAVTLFLLAVISLTLALLCFLREILLATHHTRIGEHRPGF